MTRARTQSLAQEFDTDPDAAVLRVLREAGGDGLRAGEVKAALLAAGVAEHAVDQHWRRLQPRLRAHPQVVVAGLRYRWTAKPVRLTALTALELLVRSRPVGPRRAQLLDLVRRGLASAGVGESLTEPAGAPPTEPAGGSRPEPAGVPAAEAAARQRQERINAVRELAELGGEIEELIANEADAKVLVFRLRARLKRSGLEPIERAGDKTRFDRGRHKPIGGAIRDGATVFVVRPGYIWRAPTEEILLGKAIVEQ